MNAVMNAQQVEEYLINQLVSRAAAINRLGDPRRNIYAECGYPQTDKIAAADYKGFFDREEIAARVVALYPEESWRVQPSVFETEDAEVETVFEKAWKDVSQSLVLSESVFEDENYNPIWEALKRVDILSGIGHFGVLLLGINDGLPLHTPIQGFEVEPGLSKTGASTGLGTEDQYYDYERGGELNTPGNTPAERKLIFLRAYDESLVEVVNWEDRIFSPRYGQPLMYRITLNDPKDQQTGIGLQTKSYLVHWSRVIHIADNLQTSEVIGVPRMRPVVNRLFDLQKLYGGSAEMYWQGALPGIAFTSEPNTRINAEETKENIQNYFNGLQRYLALSGMNAQTLTPQVVDATNQINSIIDAICIHLAVPKRIFIGSERGELASSQDKDTWEERMDMRRKLYLTPRIIKPFIDRLIQIGILPKPSKYLIKWAEPETQTRLGKVMAGGAMVDVLAKYIAGDVDSIVAPMDFLTNIVGMDQSEAEELLKNTLEHLTELNPDAEIIVPGAAPKLPAPEPLPEQVPPNQPPTKNMRELILNSCGANGPGGGGFRQGNTCSVGGRKSISSSGRSRKGQRGNKSSHLTEYAQKKTVKGKTTWVGSDGKPLPEHVRKAPGGVPPQALEIRYTKDSSKSLVAQWKDSKGRWQSKYTASHRANKDTAKYLKIRELIKDKAKMVKQAAKDMKSPDLKTRENAACLRTVMETGIRPGSNTDTKADYASFGATTLLGKHVKQKTNGDVYLRFATGKNKGREVSFDIKDKALGTELLNRSKAAGSSGKLFNTNPTALNNYSKTLGKGGFTAKDYRTALGTETALKVMKGMRKPATEKTHKQQVKRVGEAVAKVLGNTPTVALNSYVDPTVFHQWSLD